MTSLIRQRWPAPLLALLEDAGQTAGDVGARLYVVGGAVRDLILGRPTLDLDLVAEGDAVEVARRLGQKLKARVVVHNRFGTAKLYYGDSTIDVITARREVYPHPGALPVVSPGKLKDDLFRRDFTINALAVRVAPGPFGELVDPYGGLRDVKAGLIRILHPRSFVDDATRIFRALRYEQRLGFQLQGETAWAMRRDASMLDTISGDRLRHEIELVLKEPSPERVLRRLDEVGALARLIPSWRGGPALEARLSLAREDLPTGLLYLALLVHGLDQIQVEGFIERLHWPARTARVLRDTLEVRKNLSAIAQAERPGDIYRLLEGYSTAAIQANALAAESREAREKLRLYAEKLRHVKVSLKGDDLIQMGVEPGPRLGQLLARLLEAKLNGQAPTREDEIKLVKEWLGKESA